jgi:hypothetical protein
VAWKPKTINILKRSEYVVTGQKERKDLRSLVWYLAKKWRPPWRQGSLLHSSGVHFHLCPANAKTGEVDWRRLVNWQQACMADLSPCDALCHASWGRPTPRVSFPRLITMLNETWYSVLLVVTSSMCVASSAGVISKCQGHADVIFRGVRGHQHHARPTMVCSTCRITRSIRSD